MSRPIASLGLLLVPAAAHARRHPQFEPTDLELEAPGTTELDLQFGIVKGSDAHRIVTPDFELDLGILDNLELDLDGSESIKGATDGHPQFLAHNSFDDLWLSLKVGLYDQHIYDANNEDGKDGWAVGVQVGPKLPTGVDEHGLGVEGLFLIGHALGRVHVVLAIGGLIDPHLTAAGRPYGLESGLDLQYELTDRWALLGEVSGSIFGSSDPRQLGGTIGAQFSPTDALDLSIVAGYGLLAGNDPYGIMFGFSPKAALW
ncbi:hypothetical protein BH11MYX1_BH11MYX1_45560 [soil metagenome]